MNEIKEAEYLIKTKKPRYLNRFNRISEKWQSKLQKYQEDRKFSEYVEYSDKIKNHIGRIRASIDIQSDDDIVRLKNIYRTFNKEEKIKIKKIITKWYLNLNKYRKENNNIKYNLYLDKINYKLNKMDNFTGGAGLSSFLKNFLTFIQESFQKIYIKPYFHIYKYKDDTLAKQLFPFAITSVINPNKELLITNPITGKRDIKLIPDEKWRKNQILIVKFIKKNVQSTTDEL